MDYNRRLRVWESKEERRERLRSEAAERSRKRKELAKAS